MPKIYCFISDYDENYIKRLNKNIAIIYRNYDKALNKEEIKQIRNLCRKIKKKFFLANNIKVAFQLNLDGVFNIEREEEPKKSADLEKVEVISDVENRNIDISTDYTKSRENYYELIEKGKVALDGILEVAQEGEHPRSYEVAGQILKNMSELNSQLLDLQKSMAELENIEKKGNPTNVTNALFVGSTKDLQKLLKNGRND